VLKSVAIKRVEKIFLRELEKFLFFKVYVAAHLQAHKRYHFEINARYILKKRHSKPLITRLEQLP
jgi:hypothetical protein